MATALRAGGYGRFGVTPGLPTLATCFDQGRMDQLVVALSAHRGELERSDYRELVGVASEQR